MDVYIYVPLVDTQDFFINLKDHKILDEYTEAYIDFYKSLERIDKEVKDESQVAYMEQQISQSINEMYSTAHKRTAEKAVSLLKENNNIIYKSWLDFKFVKDLVKNILSINESISIKTYIDVTDFKFLEKKFKSYVLRCSKISEKEYRDGIDHIINDKLKVRKYFLDHASDLVDYFNQLNIFNICTIDVYSYDDHLKDTKLLASSKIS